jgi:hypothetical protein
VYLSHLSLQDARPAPVVSSATALIDDVLALIRRDKLVRFAQRDAVSANGTKPRCRLPARSALENAHGNVDAVAHHVAGALEHGVAQSSCGVSHALSRCGFKIDDEREPCRLACRQITRPQTLDDAPGVDTELSPRPSPVRPEGSIHLLRRLCFAFAHAATGCDNLPLCEIGSKDD